MPSTFSLTETCEEKVGTLVTSDSYVTFYVITTSKSRYVKLLWTFHKEIFTFKLCVVQASVSLWRLLQRWKLRWTFDIELYLVWILLPRRTVTKLCVLFYPDDMRPESNVHRSLLAKPHCKLFQMVRGRRQMASWSPSDRVQTILVLT